MIGVIELGREYFEKLKEVDQAIVARAAAERCRDCGGPLHRGDYPRKPRLGLLALGADGWDRRFSLCCGREGCRHRATPPSVRFLGRRVYVGAVVILASALVFAVVSGGAVVRAIGVPARTTRRWLRWWRGPFVASAPFVDLSARLVPAPDRRSLPASLLDRLASDLPSCVAKLLAWLAPLTTVTSPDGSRWLRGVM
jgi:hypothetical protein